MQFTCLVYLCLNTLASRCNRISNLLNILSTYELVWENWRIETRCNGRGLGSDNGFHAKSRKEKLIGDRSIYEMHDRPRSTSVAVCDTNLGLLKNIKYSSNSEKPIVPPRDLTFRREHLRRTNRTCLRDVIVANGKTSLSISLVILNPFG